MIPYRIDSNRNADFYAVSRVDFFGPDGGLWCHVTVRSRQRHGVNAFVGRSSAWLNGKQEYARAGIYTYNAIFPIESGKFVRNRVVAQRAIALLKGAIGC